MEEVAGYVFHCKKDETTPIFGHSEKGLGYSAIGGEGLSFFKTPEESAKSAHQFWKENTQFLGWPTVARIKLSIAEYDEIEKLEKSQNLVIIHTDDDETTHLVGPYTNRQNQDFIPESGQLLINNGICAFHMLGGKTAYELAIDSMNPGIRQRDGKRATLAEFLLINHQNSYELFRKASQA